MDKLQVIKVGGAILETPETRKTLLSRVAALKGPKILVHGGGRSATALATQMGINVKMIEGRRITDTAMLEIAVMTYAGKLNKSITAELQSYQTNAIGISGADGNAVLAVKRPVKDIDYGWVGDVTKVNADFFHMICQQGMVPVCCALTHDGQGQMLNTNADTLAAEIAKSQSSFSEVVLTYCFEKPGVLLDINDPSSLIPTLRTADFDRLKASGQIVEGMIPKLSNCFDAIRAGVTEVRLGTEELLSQDIPHTKIIV